MLQKDALFWIWLSEALGTRCRDFKPLISVYENPYAIFHADEEEIERLVCVSERTKAAILNRDLSAASRILDDCERLGIGVLTFDDDAYPNALRDIKTPPVLLYYKGELPDFNHRLCIGMVGTRRMSAYGLQNAYRISYELASVGALVVSGMAAGIDGVCAAAALAAKGKTVAVLGCGIDVVYPTHHRRLMEEIGKNGILLSEYPPTTKPNHYHFPVRNRIISGISQGTVVVEASIQSGSLITAKDAVTQGRDVFALPANVDSNGASGTNRLLRDGAVLVLDTTDILAPYSYVYANTLRTEALPKAKQASKADLHYLNGLGVIELTQRREATAKRASAPEPAPAPQKREAPPKATQEKLSAPKKVREEPLEQITIDTTPDALLSSLDPIQLAVLQAIPDDRAVTADSLGGLGHPYGDVIAALTMLEIMGLVQKLPGALYTKA